MEIINAIAKRKSTRKFNEKQVSDEDIHTILLAGCQAPVSSAQYDGLQLTVIKNKILLEKIAAEITDTMRKDLKIEVSPFNYYGASTIILISEKPGPVANTELVNTGTVAENMILQATEMGICSCIIWLTGQVIDQNVNFRKELAIRNGFRPIMGIAFGYSDNEMTERKLYMKIKTNFVE